MTTVSESHDVLLPGDAAPAFRVRNFLKGPALDVLERGTIYVVEFWASWCGPCIKNIPHITELQARHPNIVFIGVGVRDEAAALEQFVAERGDDMGYRVAVDAPGSTADERKGWMAENWLMAAGRFGIPDAFIVDATGRIVWVGMPKGLDDVLVAVEAGTWDVEAFRRGHSGGAIAAKAKNDADARLGSLANSQDWQAVLTSCEAEFARIPALEQTSFMQKLVALSHIDPTRAVAYAEDVRERYNDVDTLAVCTNLGLACNRVAGQLEERGQTFFARALREVAIKTGRQSLELCDRAAKERPGRIPASLKAYIFDQLSVLHELNGSFAEAINAAERVLAMAEQHSDIPHLKEAALKRVETCQANLSRPAPSGRRVVCEGDVCTIL